MDILTHNPEVWKKTVFILCYDENDGYFDHVPPFVAPNPMAPETGRASDKIDTSAEQVTLEQERASGAGGRTGPIGLGFRVPLVIASPWSRGGFACSQVFDHTSILQFLEVLLSHKTGKSIRETNITSWRRTICGDLTSAFRPNTGDPVLRPLSVPWEPFADSIHQAQFKGLPNSFRKFSKKDLVPGKSKPASDNFLPRQEPGQRPSCPLPYQLEVSGQLDADRKALVLQLSARNLKFGLRSAGAPFHAYAPGRTRLSAEVSAHEWEIGRTWAFAVSAGDTISYRWPLDGFENRQYELRLHGPNGFYREYLGGTDDPQIDVRVIDAEGDASTGPALLVRLINYNPNDEATLSIRDLGYGAAGEEIKLARAGTEGAAREIIRPLSASFGWYDLELRSGGAPQYSRRVSGRVETGRDGLSDPLIGRNGRKESAVSGAR